MSRAEAIAWAVGIVGLLLAALGWWLEPQVFYGAWLGAFTTYLGWPLGSLALLLAHALTGGRWGEALRPALLAGVATLPLLLPAVVPVILGLPSLYPWARTGAEAHFGNSFYLNVSFFTGRGIGYLVVWFGLAGLVLLGARRAGGAREVRLWEKVAPIGLVLLAFTVTFAAIDTTMSLDPSFNSSVYGMLAAAGMALLALSVSVLLTAPASDPQVTADLGKLLLSLVIMWIYLDFMQLLIVWQSDLAKEAPWYIEHSEGFFGTLRIVIAVGHFLVPFFLLLSSRLQRRPGIVAGVAALLVAMEILRSWWTVLPPLGRGIGWLDVAAMAGLCGVAAGIGLGARRGRARASWRVRHV